MRRHHSAPTGRHAAPRPVRGAHAARRRGPGARGVTIAACLGLLPGLLIAPAAEAHDPSAHRTAAADAPGQHLVVAEGAKPLTVSRDELSAKAGPSVIAPSASTNEDWAKLVLAYGGWPVSGPNVTTILRWMDSENSPESWWNRNNPLNNGYNSGGGGGFGSYVDLKVAAANVAENLHSNSAYVAIVSALETSAPTPVTARAIMESPWASSHYGYGSRWHAVDVPIVAAPPGAW